MEKKKIIFGFAIILVLASLVIVGASTINFEEEPCDFNSDGTIDVIDALLLEQVKQGISNGHYTGDCKVERANE